MNIKGYTNSTDLLKAIQNGDLLIPNDKRGQEEINNSLEKKYCNSCNETQCNYCDVYAIYNKLSLVD